MPATVNNKFREGLLRRKRTAHELRLHGPHRQAMAKLQCDGPGRSTRRT
ncbi:MAG: hypothetical protein MZV70_34515 [Desulfobacterales bacterium]|nr:hypothetical protein [Desulfobacterales bacterium]